jgi:hypothetical protein
VLGLANRYKVAQANTKRVEFTELARCGKSIATDFIHTPALLFCDPGEWVEPWIWQKALDQI